VNGQVASIQRQQEALNAQRQRLQAVQKVQKNEMQELQAQRAKLQAELMAAHEEIERQQTRNLPPLENGVLHAFRLKHIDPRLLAETLESFLGTSQLRLVPYVENNMLLTYSSENMQEQISQLVETLDAKSEATDTAFYAQNEAPQSLQIRIFWLADGMGESDSEQILPDAVIEAVGQLGLESPQLVAQSATSLAGKRDEPSHFQFRFLPSSAIRRSYLKAKANCCSDLSHRFNST